MTNVRFSGVQEGVYVRKFRVTQHLDTVSEGGSARDWTWRVSSSIVRRTMLELTTSTADQM